ncbi:MAG TPA: caspase family protein, partial [Gemmataceae bacterium]|nr:caspase family protein [Gemmataceae bacterium]
SAILKRLAYYQVQPDPTVFTDLQPPQLALDGCPDGTTADFTIRISAKPRGERDNQRLDEVILWINDYQFRRWTSAELTDLTFQADVQIPSGELRQGQNTISLQCYNRARGRATVWSTVRYTGRASETPQLLGLIVGIGNYAKAKTPLDPLGSALDARELRDAWKHTRYYRDGGLYVLADAAATRSAVLAQLDALAARARPDDLVIVSLAGHGFSAESMAAELRRLGLSTADRLAAGTFAFCGPGFDYRHPSTTCVTSNDLYARLVKVRGHKLILLDACHAGSATTYTEAGRLSLLRELTRDGPDVGPAILTACRPDETALENATIGEVTPATGLFAISVIRALGDEFDDADRNHDGRLTISELADYARTRVGKMAKELNELQAGPAPGYAAVQSKTTPKAAEPAELKARGPELSQHPEASIPQRERLLVVAARSADTKTP